MESTLHRQLKERYGPESGGRSEVRLGPYRVDAVDAEGRLIEVQAGPLGALKGKLIRLLVEHEIRVIKPVVLSRRIVQRDQPDGADRSRRRSPWRGDVLDIFDELVGLAKVFPHEHLTIEVVGVSIDEIRVKQRRGWRVVDRSLVEIVSTSTLRNADDLWTLLPEAFAGPFTTLDCARALGRPLAFAQRLAYCLRHAGAVKEEGFLKRRRVYMRLPAMAQAVP